MSNVVLIGMPASGKSTIGVVLAKILGLSFTDTDLVIQNRTGRSLQALIRERGQDGFISLENEICSRIDARDCVIATGGSVVYGGEVLCLWLEIFTVDTACKFCNLWVRDSSWTA